MSIGDFGESKVTVRKAELLATVKMNREAHHTAYVATEKLYREEVARVLVAVLDDVKQGKPFQLRKISDLVTPVEHTDDYDRIIRMLEMSIHDDITLSEQQFSHYVLDNWEWKAKFLAMSSRYST